jgi:hypothetical protein
MQRFVPAQAVPSALGGFEHWPLVGSHVPATWHGSEAVQTTGFDPTHAPAWQVFVWKQGFVPVHAVPSALAGLEHVPVAGLQTPATWHWSDAAHTTGFVPTHAPALQASLVVQAFPSSHVVPSGAATSPQVPFCGLHTPTWHGSGDGQLLGFAPTHAPAWQVSDWVQASLSLHAVPSATGCCGGQFPVLGSHVPG